MPLSTPESNLGYSVALGMEAVRANLGTFIFAVFLFKDKLN